MFRYSRHYTINNHTERECSIANRQYVPLLQCMYDSSTCSPRGSCPWKAILNSQYISQDNENLLILRFSAVKKIAKDLEAEYGTVSAGSCNLGDPSRVYVRKTQYQWRCDWVRSSSTCCSLPYLTSKQGPELLSAGPYRPITLRTYINHLASITTHACVSVDSKFSFVLDISLSSANGSNIQDGTLKVHVTLRDSRGVVVKEEWVKVHSVDAGTEIKDFIDWIFEKDEVALWWPMGYGDQVLYEVEIVLIDSKVIVLIFLPVAATNRLLKTLVVIDTVKRKIGFRHVELVQKPLVNAPGTSFFFKVNGVPMFMGGPFFDILLGAVDLQSGFQGLTGCQRIPSSPR